VAFAFVLERVEKVGRLSLLLREADEEEEEVCREVFRVEKEKEELIAFG
jgi:hypothetical protein